VSSKLNDLITDDATQANMRLIDCIKHHAGAFKLLKVTANYWPEDEGSLNLHTVWYVAIRVFLIVGAILYTSILIDILVCCYAWDYVGVVVYVTYIVDAVSVLPAQYVNQKRLKHCAHNEDGGN